MHHARAHRQRRETTGRHPRVDDHAAPPSRVEQRAEVPQGGRLREEVLAGHVAPRRIRPCGAALRAPARAAQWGHGPRSQRPRGVPGLAAAHRHPTKYPHHVAVDLAVRGPDAAALLAVVAHPSTVQPTAAAVALHVAAEHPQVLADRTLGVVGSPCRPQRGARRKRRSPGGIEAPARSTPAGERCAERRLQRRDAVPLARAAIPPRALEYPDSVRRYSTSRNEVARRDGPPREGAPDAHLLAAAPPPRQWPAPSRATLAVRVELHLHGVTVARRSAVSARASSRSRSRCVGRVEQRGDRGAGCGDARRCASSPGIVVALVRVERLPPRQDHATSACPVRTVHSPASRRRSHPRPRRRRLTSALPQVRPLLRVHHFSVSLPREPRPRLRRRLRHRVRVLDRALPRSHRFRHRPLRALDPAQAIASCASSHAATLPATGSRRCLCTRQRRVCCTIVPSGRRRSMNRTPGAGPMEAERRHRDTSVAVPSASSAACRSAAARRIGDARAHAESIASTASRSRRARCAR